MGKKGDSKKEPHGLFFFESMTVEYDHYDTSQSFWRESVVVTHVWGRYASPPIYWVRASSCAGDRRPKRGLAYIVRKVYARVDATWGNHKTTPTQPLSPNPHPLSAQQSFPTTPRMPWRVFVFPTECLGVLFIAAHRGSGLMGGRSGRQRGISGVAAQ